MSIVVSIEHGGKGVVNETASGREIAISSTATASAARTSSIARSRSDRCIPLCCPDEAVFRKVRRYQECVPVCREVIYKCEEVRDPCSSPAIREIVNNHLARIARNNARSSVPPVEEESCEEEQHQQVLPQSRPESALPLSRAETPAPADSTPAEHQLPAIHAALRAADSLPPPPPGKITVVSAAASVPASSETPVQHLLREASHQTLCDEQPQQAPQPPAQIVRPRPVRRSPPRVIRSETPYEVLKPIFVRGIWCRPACGKVRCPDPICCDPCKSECSSKPIVLELIVEGDVTLESNRAFTGATSRVESARLSAALSSARITSSGQQQAVVPVKTNSIALSSSSAGSRKISVGNGAAGRSLDLVINGQTIRIEF